MTSNNEVIKTSYSFSDIYKLSENLAKQIQLDFPNQNKNILTCTKGGVFTTGYVCNFLSYKPREIISIDPNNISPTLLTYVFMHIDDYVFIDDIYDSGKTLYNLNNILNLNQINKYFLFDRVVTVKHYLDDKINSFEILNHKEYIFFPWEIESN